MKKVLLMTWFPEIYQPLQIFIVAVLCLNTIFIDKELSVLEVFLFVLFCFGLVWFCLFVFSHRVCRDDFLIMMSTTRNQLDVFFCQPVVMCILTKE